MTRKSPARSVSVSHRYRDAVVHAVLEATRVLSSSTSRPAREREVINFLRGSKEPRERAHRDEPTFGLLVSHTARWLEELLEGLIEAGYLSLEESSHRRASGVVVTDPGRTRLDGPETFPDAKLPPRPRLGSHNDLEERLRELRRRLARAEGCSAYVVFPNATLAALAHRRPRSLAELAEVPGMGESRIRKYGRKILRALHTKSPGCGLTVNCRLSTSSSSSRARDRSGRSSR